MSLARELAEFFDPDAKLKAGQYELRCPNKQAHEHGDKRRSFYIRDTGQGLGITWNCLKCRKDVDHLVKNAPMVKPLIDAWKAGKAADRKALKNERKQDPNGVKAQIEAARRKRSEG